MKQGPTCASACLHSILPAGTLFFNASTMEASQQVHKPKRGQSQPPHDPTLTRGWCTYGFNPASELRLVMLSAYRLAGRHAEAETHGLADIMVGVLPQNDHPHILQRAAVHGPAAMPQE